MPEYHILCQVKRGGGPGYFMIYIHTRSEHMDTYFFPVASKEHKKRNCSLL